MYLTKRIYVGANYEHRQITGQVHLKKDGVNIPINIKHITYIDEEAGYWRKVNHIHKWFVDNVQNGVDDCREYYVSKENLKKLYDVCESVLKDHSLAEELLPTQSGFFFGGTEYDTYYFDSIKDTRDIIKPLLNSVDDMDISVYYQSSW